MELYVLRHAIAEDRSESTRDSERPLTREGLAKLERIVAALSPLGVQVDAMLTSPYVRAHDTAVVAAKALGVEPIVVDDLSAGADPNDFVDAISEQAPQAERVMVVGHEPDLSRLISMLIAGHDWSAVRMKKAGLAKLEVGELRVGPCATLEWLLWPKQLVRLAGKG